MELLDKHIFTWPSMTVARQ